MQRLYNLDARKFIVTNSAAVGCIPFVRDLHSSVDGCVAVMNQKAELFNSRLNSLLAELTKNLEASTFICANVYAMLDDILNNYMTSYGIPNEWIPFATNIFRRRWMILNFLTGRTSIFFFFYRLWSCRFGVLSYCWSWTTWGFNSMRNSISSLSGQIQVCVLGSIPSNRNFLRNHSETYDGWWLELYFTYEH